MARHTIQLVVKDPVALEAALLPVFIAGTREGRDFRMPHVKAVNGEPKQSRSALIRYAIERGVRACIVEDRQGAPALPQTTGTTDADRLRAAMAAAGLTNATLGALLGVSRDVVKNAVRGLAMGPALRAWLAEQEAEVSK